MKDSAQLATLLGKILENPESVKIIEKFLSEKNQTNDSIKKQALSALAHPDEYQNRHNGTSKEDMKRLLETVGFASLDDLIDEVVPESIRLRRAMDLPDPISENELVAELIQIAQKNQVFQSYLGMGYADSFTPTVILRNIIENPAWYTSYTPYQAEVGQGRLESLINFQTMVEDLTGFPIANASMLDEASAAGEAMALCHRLTENKNTFLISELCHPQTIAVVRTRAEAVGIEVIVGDHHYFDFNEDVFGVLLQYPATDGCIHDYTETVKKVHEVGALAVVAADILSLTLLQAPGEWGADIAVGSVQRFGFPMSYGGPDAAYFATKDEFKRKIPGRLVGVSYDSNGMPAYRLALQTREQHIRREKATSNICTSAVMVAVVASMYAVYHGPERLKKIALRVHKLAKLLAKGLERLDYQIGYDEFFDTVCVDLGARKSSQEILEIARSKKINLRALNNHIVTISLDETTTLKDVSSILEIFGSDFTFDWDPHHGLKDISDQFLGKMARSSGYLEHPVFNLYHTELEMARYIRRLEVKDISLMNSMIPLGSCTMKNNGATTMLAVTWPSFCKLHPFAPVDQAEGFQTIFTQLEKWLCEITGYAGFSLQPNSGAQGEYAGLHTIKNYYAHRGEKHRDICLIPESAHGTNPASAVMAGMQVVPVKCDENGNVDIADLELKAKKYARNLAVLMITYPSTHGVFEACVREACEITHRYGGQVYMDGANMNAQVGLCRPGDIGSDVSHLNLHKTFGLPHGGGGPGMGPIGVAKHLVAHLPDHPVVKTNYINDTGTISGAPWGNASVLLIAWSYIRLLGPEGLVRATKTAILNANYIAKRLDLYFPLVYSGKSGLVAHEGVFDFREWKDRAGISVEDIAKRLIDYGYHAPTMSWPVIGTMMIEPTESEAIEELDRFCEAMISIHAELVAIESEEMDREDNVLKNAPHTAQVVTADHWTHPYSREQAAYPNQYTRENKFWAPVGRVNGAHGDRNVVCSCVPMSHYKEKELHPVDSAK